MRLRPHSEIDTSELWLHVGALVGAVIQASVMLRSDEQLSIAQMNATGANLESVARWFLEQETK